MRLLRTIWRWFDDLTGASKTAGWIVTHPVPRTKKSGWFYVFGSATLFVFLVQVATGIALSSSYVTGSGQAYESLRFISSTTVGKKSR